MTNLDATSNARGLVQRLDPSGETVASYVLPDHAQQVRILNPAYDSDGAPVPWATVGGPLFAESSFIQWNDIQRSKPRHKFQEPAMGTIDHLVISSLLAHLPHPSDDIVMTAQWEGYADTTYPDSSSWVTFPPERRSIIQRMPLDRLIGSSRIPLRIWHPEFEWVLGNDVYARSIFISAMPEIISALLDEPKLESFLVGKSDPVKPEDM